ncbi:hypothetical protein BpHYR1_011055 [Brachionus plicatilis]|uniref:Uncharacterized protein n=1 Tax=Brachionus plicatilis TaxID=10195 RepID=A0A3M7PMU3_BRAPC|nr:hypothetical protein BpHYR1_011055 [Brachionus plicatilis]
MIRAQVCSGEWSFRLDDARMIESRTSNTRYSMCSNASFSIDFLLLKLLFSPENPSFCTSVDKKLMLWVSRCLLEPLLSTLVLALGALCRLRPDDREDADKEMDDVRVDVIGTFGKKIQEKIDFVLFSYSGINPRTNFKSKIELVNSISSLLLINLLVTTE